MAGGYITNPMATNACEYCPISDTNSFLELLHINYDERWMYFGIGWVYVIFNVAMALSLYWIFRISKKVKSASKKQVKQPEVSEETGAEDINTMGV